MNTLFAGLIVAGLLAPAHGEGISIGAIARPVSLPSYPLPVTRIGGPAVQLPSPVLPSVGFPHAGPVITLTASLPSPVTVPVARLPEPVAPTVVFPDPVLPVAYPNVTGGPVGPAQYPQPIGRQPDPLPIQVPVTVKSRFALAKFQASQGRTEDAVANLKAVFDSAEKPAAQAVKVEEKPQPESRDSRVRSERRITLPEWDLENEIGINPVDTTW